MFYLNFMLYTCLLSLVAAETINATKFRPLYPDTYEQPIQTYGQCMLLNCTIICKNGTYDMLEWQITNTLAYTDVCGTIEKLQLFYYNFPNGSIPKQFLGKYQHSVRSLVLSNCQLLDIESEAFANGAFEQISLENLNFSALRSTYLANISANLLSLTIKQHEDITNIEDDFFQAVATQLQVLRLHVAATKVHNFLNRYPLVALQSLDLRHNNLRNRLPFYVFARLKSLKYLNLSKCGISFLPSLIFSYVMHNLVYLDISDNELTTLYPMMFGYQQISALVTIKAQNNPYICSCQLYTHFLQIFPQMLDIYCTHVNDVEDKKIQLNIDICFAEYGMDKQVDTTASAAVSQTYCSSLNSANQFNFGIEPTALADQVRVSFDLNNMRSRKKPWAIMCFNATTQQIYKIKHIVAQVISEVMQMAQNQPYTLCVLYEDELQFNPLDCSSVYVRNLKASFWLKEEHKPLVISIVVFITLASVVAGMLLTFVVLKKCAIGQPKARKMSCEHKFINWSAPAEDAQSHSSYISNNMYELLPAYLKLRDDPTCDFDCDDNYNWLPPLDLAEDYAHVKRISTDPLPELPPAPPTPSIAEQHNIYDFY